MTPHLQCYGVSPESTGDDSTLSNASPTRPPRPVHHDQCLVRTPPQHIPRPQHSFALARRHHDSRLPNTPYRRPIPPFDSPRPIFCAATFPLLVRFLGMTIHGMHSAENDFGSAIQFFSGRRPGCTWDALTRTKSSSPFIFRHALNCVAGFFDAASSDIIDGRRLTSGPFS
jgi:hypothetical protein